MSSPSLKSKNAKWLWAFVGLNVVGVLAALGIDASDAESALKPSESIPAADGLAATAIPLVTMILTGLIPPKAKAFIVFWRWPHPLPGSLVFSKLIDSDERIDPRRLRDRIGLKAFPRSPGEQNKLWYRIYKQHEDAPAVSEAHRMFLLTRDLATLSLLFAGGSILEPL